MPAPTSTRPPIDLDRYLACDHVVRALTGSPRTFIDEALAEQGLNRNVALTTPRYTTLPDILHAAPLIATVPTRLAQTYAAAGGFSISPLPFLAPDFEVSLIWNARNDVDPPLLWMREQLTAVARGIETN